MKKRKDLVHHASPSSWYGDPSKTIDNDQVWRQLRFYENREKLGCDGCKYQQKYWNHKLCSIGRRPGHLNYCHGWRPRGEEDE